ncbi:replication-relaxation family protein [Halobacillus locisalis]|uniref:Replication-relaxation family protein n=1 Tax=Halobacillus locisalis TaxID=220753 RepID=A0A838CXZ7_9BACI|nr:replication-relaxation family protein [Halobacillus locisalis]MBA2176813.1 replication-relaxation family protein [Halobacillus locisalis]
METLVGEYREQLNGVRLSILQDLVEYRTMTTEQIRNRHFGGRGNHVNNVLVELRKKKYLKSTLLEGSRQGRKGYSCHRITEKGITALLDSGIEVTKSMNDLYLRTAQLRYVLMANDIMMNLKRNGWQTQDSRQTKNEYNLDARDNILGRLEDPDGKRYGFYVLETNSNVRTIGKIQSEIKKNSMKLPNYIIFSKGQASYEKFVRFGEEVQLATGSDIKLISLKMGMNIFTEFPTQRKWAEALSAVFGFRIISTEVGENTTHQSFPILIEYKGEEMYLADMTFSDLSMASKINTYMDAGYRWEKKRLFITYMLADSFDMLSAESQSYHHSQDITQEDYARMVSYSNKEDG